MYLLYADESGSPGVSGQEHFILAGITVFERRAHRLSLELEKIVARFHPEDPDALEIHGAPMWAGKSFWRGVPKEERIQAIKDALELIDGKHYRIIASVVKKSAIFPSDPVRETFQQVVTRFDHFLTRQYRHYKNPQRGLILFDKSNKEAQIQALALEFMKKGNEWGSLRNMAEVPVFIDSEATRLIQLADLAAYALFRKYEQSDDQFFQIIERKFDNIDGAQHGLHLNL